MKSAFKVAWTILLMSLLACGDGAGDRDEFVDYWIDSSAYCGKIADDCKQTSHADCTKSWPKKATVEQAIDLANLDSGDLAKCEQAARASDACYLHASCSQLSAATAPCQKQDQRLQLDCAGLLKALELDGSGAVTDAGASNESPGGDGSADDVASNEEVGTALCNRLAECATDSVSTSDLNTCIDQANQAFVSVLPDPQAAATCLEQADCGELKADGEGVTRACIDVDAQATHCVDDMTLHICNGDGTCRDIDCTKVCEEFAGGLVSCAFNDMDGYDKCECSP